MLKKKKNICSPSHKYVVQVEGRGSSFFMFCKNFNLCEGICCKVILSLHEIMPATNVCHFLVIQLLGQKNIPAKSILRRNTSYFKNTFRPTVIYTFVRHKSEINIVLNILRKGGKEMGIGKTQVVIQKKCCNDLRQENKSLGRDIAKSTRPVMVNL